jgi:D,D-heptose 1,7-bisphosphate phosphatase
LSVVYPIVFLDRDGTINFDPGYICEPEKVEIINGVAEGIAMLKQAGFITVIVTNQSAIGRAIGTASDVEATNAEILRRLIIENPQAKVDGVFYCPHSPEDRCECRKPKTKLAEFVRAKWSFNARECWVIGDKLRDLEFGAGIGIPKHQRILVRTGTGIEEESRLNCMMLEKPSYEHPIIVDNLKEASKHIVSKVKR